MQGETWQDYGTSGTQTLVHEEIEQAIARLERMWDDAQAHDAMVMPWFSPRKSAAIAATGRRPNLLTTDAH
jgi:hypothetical protein